MINSSTDDTDFVDNSDIFRQGRLMNDWRDRVFFLNGGYKRNLLNSGESQEMRGLPATFAKRNVVSSGIAYTGLGKRSALSNDLEREVKRVSALGKGSDFLGVGKRVSDVATMDFIGIGKRNYHKKSFNGDDSSDDDDSTIVGDLRALRRRAMLRAFFSSRRGKRVFDVSRTLEKRPRGKVDLGIAYTGVGRK